MAKYFRLVTGCHGERELKRTRLIAEVNSVRRRLQRNNKYVVTPSDNYVRQWDICTFLALLFTAIVTPAEVAFLDGNFDALWVVNRGIDLIFMADICLQFFIGYKDPTRGNVFINISNCYMYGCVCPCTIWIPVGDAIRYGLQAAK